ncbi:MAG: hypothetical protein AAGB51_14150 [Planctomycetota bacterium]
MSKGVIRVVCYVASLFVVGPLAGAFAQGWAAPDGAGNATAFTSGAPLAGFLGLVAIFALALATGRIVARLTDPAAATGCCGVVLAWAAFRSGSITDIYASGSTGPFALAIEGVLVGLLALLCLSSVTAASVAAYPDLRLHPGQVFRHTARNIGATLTPVGLMCAGASAVVVLLIASLIAVEGLSGQTFAAAMVASIAAGAASRVVAGLRSVEAPLCASVLGVAIAAGLAPILGSFIGSGSIAELARSGELLGAARLGPLDFAAGAMLGAPLGARWYGASAPPEVKPAEAG